MNIDSFESKSMSSEGVNINDKMNSFNKSFDSRVKSTDEIYKNNEFAAQQTNLYNWTGTEKISTSEIKVDSAVKNIKQMYSGTELPNGKQSLGIKEVSGWKGDLKNKAVLKSHAGYDAEIISTAKENVINDSLGNGIKTYRADDLPDLYSKNDQYVDKVRMDSNGNIIERVQTKFIGDDGRSCCKKLIENKDYDKYFTDGKVDKIEIPKDFYKSGKEYLNEQRISLEKQIEVLKSNGKTDALERKQARLDKVNQLDNMLEQSNTTSTEAIQAVKHPKLYAAKQMAPSVINQGVKDGVGQAKTAMILTGAISTVDNVSKYIDGEIAAEEAVKNIAVDTGTAGAAAFSVGFISSTTAAVMRSSSNELIKQVGSAGNGCLPAVAISYGIEVHETVIEYAKGNIDNAEFVDELGRSGAKVTGGMIGGAVGTVAGPVGQFVGTSIGSEVGEAAYDATKYVAEAVVDLALGETTIEEITEEATDAALEKVEDIKAKAEESVTEVKETAEKTTEKVEHIAKQTVETAKNYEQSAKELVSSTINYAVTSEAYVSAIEASEGAIDSSTEQLSKLENKAKEFADKAVKKAGDFGSDAVTDVKTAINIFNIKNALPFNV